MTGSFLNAAGIAAGGLAGLALNARLNKSLHDALPKVLGGFTLVLAVQMALTAKTANQLLVILGSLIFGLILGDALDIEGRMERAVHALGRKVVRAENGTGGFAAGFIAGSVLFVTGPMAILGAIQEGTSGNNAVLVTKSILDAAFALGLAVTLGYGVIFSALPVLVYEVCLTLAATSVERFMTPSVIEAVTASGGFVLIFVGTNLLGVTKVKTMNVAPAMLFAGLAAHGLGVW